MNFAYDHPLGFGSLNPLGFIDLHAGIPTWDEVMAKNAGRPAEIVEGAVDGLVRQMRRQIAWPSHLEDEPHRKHPFVVISYSSSDLADPKEADKYGEKRERIFVHLDCLQETSLRAILEELIVGMHEGRVMDGFAVCPDAEQGAIRNPEVR